MNQSITIGVAALLAGGVGGFIAGKAGSSAPEEQAAESTVLRDAKVRRSEDRSAGPARESRFRAGSIEDAMREPGQLSRLQALIDMYAGMSTAELEAEAEKLDSLPMGDRMMASMLLFSRWAEIDPMGALAYTDTMGFGGNFAKPTILRSWASIDPVNAAKYYAENPGEFRGGGRGPGGGGDSADIIAREWAKLDPQAALDWASSLEGRDRDGAMVSVISQLASSDPAQAASMAATLDSETANRAYGEIAEQWAAKDFGAAEAWINTLSGEARQQALGEAIGGLANSDPQGAAQKLAQMEAGRDRDRAVRDVAEAWAREAPSEAASWLLQQDTEDVGDAMRRVVGNWANQDSTAALGFIESQPIGEARDAATQAYLWTQRDTEPSQAIELAESISDDRDRSRTVAMTAFRWMREDETAARAYIEQSTAISDEAKQRILDGDGGRGFGGPGGRGRGR